jgi:hypothetical protein
LYNGDVTSAYTVLDGNVKGEDRWGDLFVDDMILLKWMLKK